MSTPIPTFNRGVIHPVECISDGKALIAENYWLMVGICFVGVLVAGMAPFYLLYGPMLCGISYCLLALKRNEPIEFVDLFKGLGFFGPAYLAGLIQMLPVFVVALPLYILWIFTNVFLQANYHRGGNDAPSPLYFVGFALAWLSIMVITGVMHLICSFSFPLVVEWKMNGWDAVKTSAQAIRANLGGAIGLLLLCGLMMLAGALLCGVGAYLVLPITHAAWTIAYHGVFPEYPRHLDIPPDPPQFAEWKGEASI